MESESVKTDQSGNSGTDASTHSWRDALPVGFVLCYGRNGQGKKLSPQTMFLILSKEVSVELSVK